MKHILFILIFTLFGCNSHNINELILVEKSHGKPIEGAWIEVLDDNIVLRSDINGKVSLPEDIAANDIRVISKSYKTKLIDIEQLNDSIIVLDVDSSRISAAEASLIFTSSDTLIGAYNQFRANNDLLFYDLEVKIDIANKFISGTNKIRFKMLEDANKIQIDLHDTLAVDSIRLNSNQLRFTRQYNSILIDFPEQLLNDNIYEIDFHYSGYPVKTGRFGGIVFDTDSLGNPWVYTACQGPGASVWWPNKDQQFDEVDSMNISVTVPDSLVCISNGHFVSANLLENNWKTFNWKVSYPINNYNVALNIGNYTHFSDSHSDYLIDYFVQPYHLEAAKRQFAQVVPMIECFEKHFGDYPFPKDGFKLIEVPYSGMEHQTAVAYGNLFQNGYLGRDWTGVGISTKFDFIIIHESGHEWFGNIITAADDSDAWIHEGWTTYAEAVYVECMWGYDDAQKYLNGYKNMIRNREPILGPTGVNHWPTGDMYFKGALFLNTLRSIIDDDDLWWSFIYDYSHHFRGYNIYTTDVLTYTNQYFKRNLTPVFEQYLLFSELPTLQLKYNDNVVQYRWNANAENFNMPIKAGIKSSFEFIFPTNEWKSLTIDNVNNWQIDIDRFYIDIEIID